MIQRATPYERYVLRKEQIDADSTEPTVTFIEHDSKK